MTDAVTIEIQGLREIQDKIKRLPAGFARRIVYSSLRKGAAIVRKEAQKNVPVRTGALRKGFKVSRSRIHRGPQFGIYLTLKKGRGRSDPKDPFYGRWVENGYRVGKKTVSVTVNRSDRPGRTRTVKRGEREIPGQYFMRRAFDAKASEAVSAIVADADTKAQQLINDLGL